MSEKQTREVIIERMKYANARELSNTWSFVRALVEPHKREAENGQTG